MNKKGEITELIKQTKEKIDDFKEKIDKNEITTTLKDKSKSIDDIVIKMTSIRKFLNEEMEIPSVKGAKAESNKAVSINSVCWSLNDKFAHQFVTVDESGRIVMWDAKKFKKICEEPKATNGLLMACAIEPTESKLIVCGGIDSKVLVFSINPKGKKKEKLNLIKKEKELSGHIGMVTCAGFLDTQYIITGSNDSSLLLWDLEKPQRSLQQYDDHDNEIISLDIFRLNGNLVASGSGDTTARIWDIRMKVPCLRIFENSGNGVNCVKFVPHSYHTIAAGCEDSAVKLYDLRTLAPIGELKDNNSYECVHSLAFSQSGRILFSTYNNNIIKIWDVLKEKLVGTLTGDHKDIIKSISMSKNGSTLVSASKDGVIHLWN